MNDLEIFNYIITLVKTNENYIPRNYQTIGGMWTVDVWKYKNITVRVMDEGYTTEILTLEFSIRKNYNNQILGDVYKLTEILELIS